MGELTSGPPARGGEEGPPSSSSSSSSSGAEEKASSQVVNDKSAKSSSESIVTSSQSSIAKASPPPSSLTLAFVKEQKVTFAVAPDSWQTYVPPLSVDEKTFKDRAVSEWSSNMKAFAPPTSSLHRIYYVQNNATSTGHCKNRAVAVEVDFPSFQIDTDLDAATVKAEQALQEFKTYEAAAEVATRAKLNVPSSHNENGTSNKPTLLAVLTALLSEDVTTPEQRDQINQLVFAFLQNELSLPKLYSHLAQVTGYSTLRSIVRAIGQRRDYATAPTGVQEGAHYSIKSINPDTANRLSSPRSVSSAGFPTPCYFFKSPEEHAQFFSESANVPSYLKEVSASYRYPFWIDLPGTDRIPSRIGHHCLDNGNVWLMIGGVLDEEAFSFNPSNAYQRKLVNGWNTLTIVNQLDYKCEGRNLQGQTPSALVGTSAKMVGDFQGFGLESECLLIFGGTKDISHLCLTESREKSQPLGQSVSDDLHALNLQTCRWHPVAKGSGPWPSARAFHCSGLVLAELPDNPDECEMVCMFVYGGLGEEDGQSVALDNLWLLDLVTATWSEVSVEYPVAKVQPTFGAACCIAGFNRFIIHGGWVNFASNSAISDVTSLLSFNKDDKGLWKATITPLEIIHPPASLNRAFHTAFVLKVETTNIKTYDLGAFLEHPTVSSKNVLLLAGGITNTDKTAETITLIDLTTENDLVVGGRYINSPTPQLRPFSDLEVTPAPRVGASINFFPCYSPVPSTRPKPPVPSLFVHGGYPTARTNSPAFQLNNHFETTWILAFPSVDPIELNWYARTDATRKRQAPASQVAPEAITLEETPALQYLKKRKGGAASQDLCKLFADHLKHSAAWACGLNFSPGLFHALGAMLVWPFSAVGNLLENASALSTRATAISVDFGVATTDGSLYLSITDNGRGLAFTTFNRALKRFGNWDRPIERRDAARGESTLQYGMGLKFAFSRLGHSALVISRTKGTIGLSLLSQALHFHIDSQTISCPSCFWRLPSKETIYPEAEHWRHQQKIQQYSPFDSPTALAEQINVLGPRTGTRLIFFDWKNTFPSSFGVDVQDGSGYLTCCPPRALYEGRVGQEKALEAQSDLIHLDTKVDCGELSITASDGIANCMPLPKSLERLSSSKVKLYPLSTSAASSSSYRFADGKTNMKKPSDTRVFEDLKTYLELAEEIPGEAMDPFPLWSTARNSIDYSLSTFLYWSMLFCSAKIWHAGKCLIPATMSGHENPQDPFAHSLYRYLKSRLHAMVELDYLFEPADGQREAFGLLGFLNPVDSLIANEVDISSPVAPAEEKAPTRFYETGVLLYYKERLIRRLFVPFPASADLLDRFGRGKYPRSHFEGKPIFMFPCTALIHVPDWMFPNPTHEDFVVNRSPVMDKFIYNVKELVAQYLSVCLDPERLKSFIIQRGELLVQEAGKSRPLSPLLHLSLLKQAPPQEALAKEEQGVAE